MMQHRLHARGTNAQRGIANTWRHSTDGSPRRDDNRRQGHQRQHHPANQRDGSRHAKNTDENCQAQNTEHNRRHSRKIVDVDFDQFGDPVLWCEFLEIDSCCHADRKSQHEADRQRQNRSDKGTIDARHLGIARRAAKNQIVAEGIGDRAILHQLIDKTDHPVIDPAIRLGCVARDEAPQEGIHIIIHRKGDALRRIKNLRVIQHRVAQPLFRTLRDDFASRLAPGTPGRTGRLIQRGADHPARISVEKRFCRLVPGRIELCTVKGDFQRHVILEKAGYPLRED